MDYVSFDYIKKERSFSHIKADPHVYYELADQFTFEYLVQNLCLSIVVSIGMERFVYLIRRPEKIYVGLLDKIRQFFVKITNTHMSF